MLKVYLLETRSLKSQLIPT